MRRRREEEEEEKQEEQEEEATCVRAFLLAPSSLLRAETSARCWESSSTMRRCTWSLWAASPSVSRGSGEEEEQEEEAMHSSRSLGVRR